jgi:hypothetical protein
MRWRFAVDLDLIHLSTVATPSSETGSLLRLTHEAERPARQLTQVGHVIEARRMKPHGIAIDTFKTTLLVAHGREAPTDSEW